MTTPPGAFSLYSLDAHNPTFIDNHSKSYTGKHPDTGDTVLYRVYKTDPSTEIAILRRIGEHPHIVKLLDVCGTRGLVMAYHAPLLSNAMIGRVKFAEEILLDILHQLFKALYFLHSHGIMHCNVRPQSIQYDGILKLTNFSHAEMLTSEPPDKPPGLLWWRAPEMLRGEMYNEAIDLWAAGVVFLQLAHGKMPWALYDGDDADKRLLTAITEFCLTRQPLPMEFKPNSLKLLSGLLTIDPGKRITALMALTV